MVSIMMILFSTIVLVLLLRLYFTCCFSNCRKYAGEPPVYRRRSRSFDLAVSHPASPIRRGLDPSVLNSIPILTFSSEDEEIECAFCLQKTLEGEKIRILPKCKHGFHMDCIGMWLHSNSTCPICRNSVSNQPSNSSLSTDPSPSSSSPSGTQNEMLAVNTPRQIDEDEATKLHVKDQLKALKRLLCRVTTGEHSSTSSADPGRMGPEQC